MAWIFAAIAMMAVIGLLVFTSNPNARRHQEQHQLKPADQTASAKPFAHENIQEQAQCRPEDREKRNYWERFVCYVETRDKFFTAFGTLIIAAFTVCLAFATGFLYFATKDLVEGADNNAEKQLRAYVFVENGQIIVTPDGGGFTAHIIFKNFGQTPGREFSTWLGGGVYDFGDLPFPKERKSLSERVNRSIIGPSAMTPVNTQSAALGKIEDIRNSKRAIFVWGGVDYVDAFGKQRHFYIRTRMSGPEVDFGNGRSGWPLTPHPAGYESN